MKNVKRKYEKRKLLTPKQLEKILSAYNFRDDSEKQKLIDRLNFHRLNELKKQAWKEFENEAKRAKGKYKIPDLKPPENIYNNIPKELWSEIKILVIENKLPEIEAYLEENYSYPFPYEIFLDLIKEKLKNNLIEILRDSISNSKPKYRKLGEKILNFKEIKNLNMFYGNNEKDMLIDLCIDINDEEAILDFNKLYFGYNNAKKIIGNPKDKFSRKRKGNIYTLQPSKIIL